MKRQPRSANCPADGNTNRGLLIQGLQFRDVGQQFLFIRQAREEIADHLVRRSVGLRPVHKLINMQAMIAQYVWISIPFFE